MPQPTLAVIDGAGDPQEVFTISPLGQTDKASSRSVVLASDQPTVPVKTSMSFVHTECVRPSNIDPYLFNDVISPTTGAANLVFANVLSEVGGTGYIVRATLLTDQKDCTAAFRLYLFTEDITPFADSAPFTPLYDNATLFAGYIDFPAVGRDGTASTAALAQWAGQLAVKAAAADRDLYGILVTKTGFIPDSAQKFYVEIVTDTN